MPTNKPDIGYGQGVEPSTSQGTGQGDGQGTGEETPAPGGGTWDDYLTAFGLPPEIRAEVDKMIAAGRSAAEIIAYIRGTQWYAKTYPGISEGIAKGVISNEADYRAYVNAINQYARQYLGRDVTSDEIAAWLREGVGVDVVGKRFAGQAYASVYAPEAQYALGAFGDIGTAGTTRQLTPEEVKAYGEQEVGLGSATGMKIEAALQRAVVRMRGAFAGVAATPGLSLGPAGLSAPSLTGQRGNTPDIGA